MEYLKVVDHPELVREKQSKAILNTDVEELNKYRRERDEKLRSLTMINEFEQVKSDVQDIKRLLTELIGHIK